MPQKLKLPDIPLHGYQKRAKDFIKDNRYCSLMFEMGLGKTLITLSALMELNPSCNVLIIAPRTIAVGTWQAEIDRWNLPLRTVSLVVNENGKKLTKQKREKLYDTALTDKPGVYFVNREIVPAMVEYYEAKKETFPFPYVIIDEAQSFKSHSSERFKALKRVRPYIARLIELTGTPAPNGLMDLWSQIYLLDEGERLGKNITAYRNTYFRPGMMVNGYPVSYIPLPGSEKIIYDKIKDIAISMKNIASKLPPLTVNDIYAHMDDKEKAVYKGFMKTNVLQLDSMTANSDDQSENIIEAKNAAVLAGKLCQMASGNIYTDEKHNYAVIHERKLEVLENICENVQSPLLVCYIFQSDKDSIIKYLEKKKYKPEVFDGTAEMIKKWNDGKVPIMLLQPASGGFGINIQKGGHTMVWYSMPWSLEHYLQTNARLYRQGQTEPVIIHRILTKGTIDERIAVKLKNKDMTQKDLLNAVNNTILSDKYIDAKTENFIKDFLKSQGFTDRLSFTELDILSNFYISNKNMSPDDKKRWELSCIQYLNSKKDTI